MKNEIERKTEHPIDNIFVKRWSPRAMQPTPFTKEDLMTLFEAARWAPSSYNNQPWKFVYAMHGTENWQKFLDIMVDFNKLWAQHAAALILVCSRKTFEHNNKPSRTHEFDTGAAWMSLALQASMKGFAAHGMEGFDYDKARNVFHVPEEYDIEAIIAVGRHGKKESLPEQMQQNEFPNQRKKVSEFVMEGSFR